MQHKKTSLAATTYRASLPIAALALAAAAVSTDSLAANDYATKCGGCHGADPKGAGAPFSFKGKKDASATKAAISTQPMMASLATLTDAELNAIALEMGGQADIGAPTATPTPAPTATPAPSATPTPSAPPAPSATPAPTATPVPKATPAPTASPTPTASPSPTPSTAASASCDGASAKAKPIMFPIGEQNATVGQTLSFTVSALDCNDVPILIKASRLKGGSLLSEGQDFDTSGAWSGQYQFTPSSSQANQSFLVRFSAKQTADSHKASKPWKVRIRVFPAGSGYEEGAITGVKVQSARWSDGALLVSGRVDFSHALNASDRKAYSEGAQITLIGAGDSQLGTFPLQPSGKWNAKVDSLSDSTVPCEVSAQLNGREGSRSVKKAPETCLK